jgi:probable phosphoglycerate mutase
MEPERKIATTRIWILRHGRTTLNDAQVFQGCGAPSELTGAGVESARAAGARLKSEAIDVIYTSPLRRAMQTAELVRQSLPQNQNLPALEVDEALREMELPLWEGLPYTTVREQYPEQYQSFRQSPESFSLIGQDFNPVHPVMQMEKRVIDFISTITRRNAGRHILLVTHGGPASVLLLSALQLPLRHFHSLQITHGALSCLTVHHWPEQVSIDSVNEICHSGRVLPKLKSGKSGLRLLMVASDREQSATRDENWLAEMLHELPIHGALATNRDSHALASRLLGPDHKSTIQTGAADFRNAIDRHRSSQRPEGLSNLLITAPGEWIAAVLARCMGWYGTGVQNRLKTCRGLSVIHLPGSNAQPVLQAMNLCAARTVTKEELV